MQSAEGTVGTLAEADLETASDDYARRFQGEAGAWMLEVQRRALNELLDLPPGSSVLDVGGGHAQLTALLLERGYVVTVQGSDPRCAARLEDEISSGRVQFAEGSSLALPFPDRSFDGVVSVRLVSHTPEWRRLVRELARVARQTVVIDYPPVRGLNVLYPVLFWIKKKLEGNTRAYLRFQPKEIAAEFARWGMHQVRSRTQFGMPMVVHRVLKKPRVSEMLERAARAIGLTALSGGPDLTRFDRDTTGAHEPPRG